MKKLVFMFLCFIAIGLFGCSSFESPFSVVEKSYKYLAEGKVNDCYELLTEDGKNMLKSFGGGASALSGATEAIKAKKGIKKIELIKEDITGDTATVKSKIHYGNGTFEDDTMKLVKEKGAWKIAVSK